MGQATVDLPDPMQSPAAPATAGTDDLLAQLAGDEIERLLAETETERPAASASAASPLPDFAAAKSAPVESAAPNLPTSTTAPAAESLPAGVPQRHAAAQPPDSPAAAAASAPAEPTEEKENLTSQLDALFESLNGASSPPASAPAPAAAALAIAEPLNNKTGVTDPGSEAAAPLDTASSAAELKALGEPIAAAVSPAVSANAAASPQAIAEKALADEEEYIRPSLLVRLLEIINSPLGGCTDPVLNAVGKIAIATLLNAIAVLAYTLAFRHR